MGNKYVLHGCKYMLFHKLSLNKILASLIIIFILLNMYTPVTTSFTNVFKHLYTSFKSTTGGDVYPGSTGDLSIGFLYNSTVNATNIYACLTLPDYFNPVNPCSPAYSIGGGVVEKASAGDIVEFRYRLTVDRGARPGNYTVLVNITYRYVNSTVIEYELHNITLTVKPYPPLKLTIVDSYWSPAGYPGSVNVDLVVILGNNGSSTILSGEAQLILPSGFRPDMIRVDLPSIAPHDRATLVFNNIEILNTTRPGPYTFTLEVDAVLSTSDGVRYNDSTTLYFNVMVEAPPKALVNVIDYGLTTTKPYPGLLYTRFYIEFLSIDNRVIDSGLAEVELLDTVFVNGSNKALIVFNGPYRYGDVFTLTTPRLIVPEKASHLIVSVKLSLLMVENNAYYWVYRKYVLVVNLSKPNYTIYLIDSYWGEGRAYPGSTSEILYVEIMNLMDTSVRDVYAKLLLPSKYFIPDQINP